jgi:predicted RNase H-like nuclease (RuvC/YqgF family)
MAAMDGMGQLWAILSIGVLVVVVLALAVAVQSLRAHELEQTLRRYTNAWERLRADLKTQTEEIRRLQSALRAERAHVAQLQRKVLLVQALLDAELAAEGMPMAEV